MISNILNRILDGLEFLDCKQTPHILVHGVSFIIPPVYEVYRGYIVFAFSVCLCVCSLFFVKDFSGTTVPRILKFGTIIGYCVRKNQPHMAYQSLYLSIFLSFQ